MARFIETDGEVWAALGTGATLRFVQLTGESQDGPLLYADEREAKVDLLLERYVAASPLASQAFKD